MEKIFSQIKGLMVTIRTRYPRRLYLPKATYQMMLENVGPVYSVDMYIDEKRLLIKPNNSSGEFILSHNGSSPNGRNVSFPQSYLEKYNVREGHYRCDVDKEGAVYIQLDRRVEG